MSLEEIIEKIFKEIKKMEVIIVETEPYKEKITRMSLRYKRT